jgi:hypothetical protein
MGLSVSLHRREKRFEAILPKSREMERRKTHWSVISINSDQKEMMSMATTLERGEKYKDIVADWYRWKLIVWALVGRSLYCDSWMRSG